MEISKGKLKNITTSEELNFQTNPQDMRWEKVFHYGVEPKMSQGKPFIYFQSGGMASLSFSLYFDLDIDSSCSIKSVLSFLESLEKIDPDSKSTPRITFRWGTLTTFEGYIERYCACPLRFDPNGEPTSLKLEMQLIQGDLDT